ncbi:hypothetical protein H5410_053359 [Solanum commersonii]|uniref:Uncharacterized protein n=1 Tax=Solanum commersonii TaxID=4109 RepID=A0A9J5X622_SOLCO|nr:hypothetical protein H5410_053359 [Solanum commersonii]
MKRLKNSFGLLTLIKRNKTTLTKIEKNQQNRIQHIPRIDETLPPLMQMKLKHGILIHLAHNPTNWDHQRRLLQ